MKCDGAMKTIGTHATFQNILPFYDNVKNQKSGFYPKHNGVGERKDMESVIKIVHGFKEIGYTERYLYPLFIE